MNSHYWYFVVSEDMKVVTVYKKHGILFDSYDYLCACPTKIKQIIKKLLAYSPAGHRYTFVYKENEHDFSKVQCVKVEKIKQINYVDIWESIPATEFFTFTKNYEIPRPDTYKGMLVFQTLQNNIDNGLIRFDRDRHVDFYFVTVDNVYVYPLRAL